jgi:DNA-binding transcriptional LysR family regulator
MLQLRYFLDVADTLSISKTAKKGFVSQPAVSKQLIALETELKTRLFDRSPRGIALTAEGEKLYQCLRRCEEDFNTTCAAFSREMTAKRLLVGFTASIDMAGLLLQAVSGIHTDIEISCEAFASSDPFEAKYDIVVSYESVLKKTRSIQLELFRARQFIVYSCEDPLHEKPDLSPADFSGKALIVRSYTNEQKEICRRLRITPQVCRKNNISSIILSIIAQKGFCIMDELCKEISFPTLALLPIPESERIMLAYPDDAMSEVVQIAQNLAALLRQSFSRRAMDLGR